DAECLNGGAGHGLAVARFAHGALDRPRRLQNEFEGRSVKQWRHVFTAAAEGLKNCLVDRFDVEPFAGNDGDGGLRPLRLSYFQADQPTSACAFDLELAVFVACRYVEHLGEWHGKFSSSRPFVEMPETALVRFEEVVELAGHHHADDVNRDIWDRLAFSR